MSSEKLKVEGVTLIFAVFYQDCECRNAIDNPIKFHKVHYY